MESPDTAENVLHVVNDYATNLRPALLVEKLPILPEYMWSVLQKGIRRTHNGYVIHQGY